MVVFHVSTFSLQLHWRGAALFAHGQQVQDSTPFAEQVRVKVTEFGTSTLIFCRRALSAAVSLMICLGLFTPALALESETDLDADTKQSYYAEYQQIAAALSEESHIDIEVAPAANFDEYGWQTPEEYQAYLTDFITQWGQIVFTNNDSAKAARISTIVTKQGKVSTNSKSYTIDVTGSFYTSSNGAKQVFSGVAYITSSANSSNGSAVTWVQKNYSAQFIDAGETCWVTVNGTLTDSGATFSNLLIDIEFYCNDKGTIS